MKRVDLERHLKRHGCEFSRDTGPHTIWVNRDLNTTAPVPKGRDVNTYTAQGICKRLGIPKPPGK